MREATRLVLRGKKRVAKFNYPCFRLYGSASRFPLAQLLLLQIVLATAVKSTRYVSMKSKEVKEAQQQYQVPKEGRGRKRKE